MWGLWKRMFERRPRAPWPEAVAFDEDGVVQAMSDGTTQSIRWHEIREIDIVTTDQGPFVDDVFWCLLGDDCDCIVPSETPGVQSLLGRFQSLPGFDDEAVIRAMGCTDNDRFVVWKRPDA